MGSHKKRWVRASAPADGIPVFEDVDPDSYFNPPKGNARNHERQTARVCSVAFRVVSEVLLADVADPLLQSLQVLAVEPAPDASRLLVRMMSTAPLSSWDVVMERLQRAQGLVRSALAQSLQRKRTPALAFVLQPPGPEDPWEP